MAKKKLLLAAAAALLSLTMAGTCLAAQDNFSVQADEMEYDLQSGKGSARGNVVLVQGADRATADAAEFDSKAKTGHLLGNVVANKGDAHVTCDELIAHNENDFSAVGQAMVSREGRSVSASRINYYQSRQYAETVGDWAKLTDTDGSVLEAAKIDYDLKTNVAKAYGGVTINSTARQLEASADSAVYTGGATGQIELIGNAKATQNGNSVAGDRLRLTNNNVATMDGNIKIYYLPEEKQKAAENKANA